jgi:hypothetical protein
MDPFVIIFAIPIAIWSLSYLYLVAYYKKWNLLNVMIHESSRYSFLGTVFYFNHFLRELLIDTFFALCIFWTYNATHSNSIAGKIAGNLTIVLFAFILFMIVVVSGSIKQVGLKNTFLDLTQFREVDTVVAFGSHWQMHFLSTLALMLLLVLPGIFQVNAAVWPLIAIFFGFFVLSLIFRTDLRAITDARWSMHGAREGLTFFFLAVLPSYVINLRVESISINIPTILALLIIAAITLYYFWVFLRVDVRGLAQGDFEMPYLIASHFFEHVLDFGYIFLLVGLLITL